MILSSCYSRSGEIVMIGLIIIVELHAAQYGEEQHNHYYKMQRLRVTMRHVMLIRIIMTMVLFSWRGAAAYSRSMARWRFCKSKASNGAGLRLIVMIIIINFLIMIVMFNFLILIIMFNIPWLSYSTLQVLGLKWRWPPCDHLVLITIINFPIMFNTSC